VGTANFVPSGFAVLDEILGGGFIKGGLYIIGARPAVGKSSFAVNLADTIKGSVLFVSLEMGDELITAKRCARITGIPSGYILNGKLSEAQWEKIGIATSYLHRSAVYINSRFDLTVDQIQGLAQSIPDIQAIIIDYLGLIRPATQGGSTYENVSQISRDLKRLALSLNVPVVCLSQLSRTVEGREDKRPRLSDLRDSGAIEQDADAVMFLYREDYYRGAGGASSAVQLNVAKNRHGSCGTSEFTFYRAISAFKEVEQSEGK
jgi:replicative DNA helicase